MVGTKPTDLPSCFNDLEIFRISCLEETVLILASGH